jgi:hypothetical protein
VVLIDEYDKPIIDNIIDKQVYDKVKRILHNFYQVIKGNDTHLKFVFMTGVSIFSGLNNLNDITVDERYSAICGYTQKELEMNFKDYILLLSKKLDLKYEKIIALIKEWYNGYSWDGEMSVYNPFSTLMLFDKNIFENYWFRTGTPTFLIELLKKNNQLTGIFEPIVVDDIASNSYDGGDIDTIDLLFQTGYLTIKERKIYLGVPEYTLNVANFEVKDSLVRYLLNAYSNYPLKELKGLQTTAHQQLQDLDGEGLSESIGKLFVNIPYPLHIVKEAYWHSLFLLAMNALGFDFKGEILTNKGRIDAVWKGKDFVVVCEIKYSVKKTIIKMLEEALKQIEDKKYYEAYSSKKVVLLGIAFNGKDVKCKFGKLYSKNKS